MADQRTCTKLRKILTDAGVDAYVVDYYGTVEFSLPDPSGELLNFVTGMTGWTTADAVSIDGRHTLIIDTGLPDTATDAAALAVWRSIAADLPAHVREEGQ